MSLTVRNVVEGFYRYLAKEQRTIPHTDPDFPNPLPEALGAINGALQEMASLAPLFAVKQPRSAWFRAPTSTAVTGLTRGGQTATASWPTGSAGCIVALPGDSDVNRIVSITGDTATLQFPHMSDVTEGTAHVRCDSCDLGGDVIAVLEPVRVRGGLPIRAATGRNNLSMPNYNTSDDFGRPRASVTGSGEQAYFVESAVVTGIVQLRMMLRNAPASDLVLEYQARCSLGHFTSEHVYTGGGNTDPGTPIPVASQFVESIFQPLALFRFHASSVFRNVDVPKYVADQAETARKMLKSMKPQGRKDVRIYPRL